MSDAYTLSTLFGLDHSHPEERLDLTAATRAVTTKLAKLRRDAVVAASPAQWGAAATQVLRQLHAALDVPIGSVLGRAWGAYAPFVKYCDRVQYPPEKTATVALKTHTIRSIHRPYVEVLLNGRSVGRIDLEAQVTITLEGAVLTIRGGRIVEVTPGKARVAGSVSCEGAEILSRPLGDWELLPTISLGEGLPIGPVRAPAHAYPAPGVAPEAAAATTTAAPRAPG